MWTAILIVFFVVVLLIYLDVKSDGSSHGVYGCGVTECGCEFELRLREAVEKLYGDMQLPSHQLFCDGCGRALTDPVHVLDVNQLDNETNFSASTFAMPIVPRGFAFSQSGEATFFSVDNLERDIDDLNWSDEYEGLNPHKCLCGADIGAVTLWEAEYDEEVFLVSHEGVSFREVDSSQDTNECSDEPVQNGIEQ